MNPWKYLVCAGVLALSACSSKTEPEPKPIVAVKVATASRADVQRRIEAPATVFPREQANIAARITAPIRQLNVRKGDHVSAGQVLALLDNRDVTAQRAEAVAALADAQASLQKTRSGTLPTDVERGRGQVESTRAAYEQAQKILEKRQRLFEQGAIPERDLLQSQTDVATTKANFEVAQRSLDILQRQSAEHDIKIAESRVEQSQSRLKLQDAQLAFTEIHSPFDGTITEQMVYPGDMASPATPMFTIVDLSLVNARAQVPEAEAASLRTGLPCTFTSGDNSAAATAGRVTVVNRAVDPQRRTIETWCEIVNPPKELRAGVFGNVTIIAGTDAASIVVPLAAVQFNEGTSTGSVMIVDDKHQAHKRDVATGVVANGKVQIKSGLSEGETVIIEGGYGIADGTQVTVGEKNESAGDKKDGKS